MSPPIDQEAHDAWEQLRADRQADLLILALHSRDRSPWGARCDARHSYLERHKLIERVALGRARMPRLWQLTPLGKRVVIHGKSVKP